jgi:hypothetical protein
VAEVVVALALKVLAIMAAWETVAAAVQAEDWPGVLPVRTAAMAAKVSDATVGTAAQAVLGDTAEEAMAVPVVMEALVEAVAEEAD